jgi:hypothetical protein
MEMEKITCKYGKYMPYMVGVKISPQLLYRRKEAWYQEHMRLCGPHSYSGKVWTIPPHLEHG